MTGTELKVFTVHDIMAEVAKLLGPLVVGGSLLSSKTIVLEQSLHHGSKPIKRIWHHAEVVSQAHLLGGDWFCYTAVDPNLPRKEQYSCIKLCDGTGDVFAFAAYPHNVGNEITEGIWYSAQPCSCESVTDPDSHLAMAALIREHILELTEQHKPIIEAWLAQEA